jgi:N-methylhydantoinase A/oxoprolinase/acetone carboxylase beta subunit
VHDYIRSELRLLADVAADHAEKIFRELQAKAEDELKAEGIAPSTAHFLREMDLRYSGQGYELRTSLVGLFVEALSETSLAAARERFDERHAQVHGHAAKERPVEVVSYRLRVRVDVPKYEPRPEPESAKRGDRPPSKGTRRIHGGTEHSVEAILYQRDALPVGISLAGPAIVEQFDATTVVPESWSATVDTYRNLLLTKS